VPALAVLAVVFGVLLMHGAANAQHHAPVVSAHGQHADVTSHLGQGPQALGLDCDGGCSTSTHGLLALCVAVLAAAAAVLIVTRTGRRPLWLTRRGPPAPVLPGRTAVPRPRDVVAELCICRT
jgi:hypothetical protein